MSKRIKDVVEKECIYTLTYDGYIKRIPADTFRVQKRGGKGICGHHIKEEDHLSNILVASTHDTLLLFTNFGRCYSIKGYCVPEASRTAKGVDVANTIRLCSGERVTSITKISENDTCDKYVVIVTRRGIVKRMESERFRHINSLGIRALKLNDGDEPIAAQLTQGTENIFVCTNYGAAICFAQSEIHPMGWEAIGMCGIKLRDGDYCIDAGCARTGCTLFSVTENGYGKRTEIDEYLRGNDGTPQKKGGMGLTNFNVTIRTGKVIATKIVDENEDVLMCSDDGTIIRIAASSINILGRATQGVCLMRLSEGARVSSCTCVSEDE